MKFSIKKQILTWCFLGFISLGFAQSSSLIDLVNSFRADEDALNGIYNIRESEEYYQRFTLFFKEWDKRVEDIDFDKLSQQGKTDYIILKNLINKKNYFLNLDYKSFKEVSYVTDFADEIYSFIIKRRRGENPKANELAQAFSNAEFAIDKKIETLKNIPFKDWLGADKSAKIVLSLAESLKEAYEFYYSYNPEFTWWMPKPYESLSVKLLEYSDFLKNNFSTRIVKDDGSGIIGNPIGRNAIIKSLSFEFIPYTPEELIAIAENQFEWCKKEMIKASQEMGYEKNWKAALEHVKETYVSPEDQPQIITDLYNQSVNFIEKRDLITLPDLAKETWKMKMMTPERQKINPFFTGGRQISISYPTHDMTQEDKLMSMRGNNPNFSRAVVHHELLPGHNLQFFMSSRNKSYRSLFYTPFWGEGWALYWEINLWNKNFAKTPEQKLGMLFWRIHRCARIIFSLKYHMGEMSPQQCIDLLVNEVGHEYANAEAEVRRSFTSSYAPLYQVAYMIGGLQFYALRNEMLELGWTEKQFHNRIMKENRMPVEILRKLIKDLPINKEDKTKWKFKTEFK